MRTWVDTSEIDGLHAAVAERCISHPSPALVSFQLPLLILHSFWFQPGCFPRCIWLVIFECVSYGTDCVFPYRPPSSPEARAFRPHIISHLGGDALSVTGPADLTSYFNSIAKSGGGPLVQGGFSRSRRKDSRFIFSQTFTSLISRTQATFPPLEVHIYQSSRVTRSTTTLAATTRLFLEASASGSSA